MKFNPNQRYTRWSIRRLSVGVASVVVASGFFVLVGQPSSARADVVNPTPAQVVPDDASVSEKGDLSSEVLNKAVDVDLSSEQSVPTPKASLDTISSPEKVDVADKDQVVAPKKKCKHNLTLRNKQKMQLNLWKVLRLQFLDKIVKRNQRPP